MAVVILTFTGSDDEIVSGIPQTMTIESNIPATIHFTLDGSTPTTSSPIYVGTFEMPDGQNSVTLSAFGVDGIGDSGPILTQVFAPDVTTISIGRHTGLEGFVIDRADDGLDNVIGYGADGDANRIIDFNIEDLDIIRSERGFQGLLEGTAVKVTVPDPSKTATLTDDNFQPFSTPEVGELFNPEARTILIDNRKDNDLNITLRPYGSLHNVQREFGGKRLLEPADDATYVSGGFVRRFYDSKKKVMVSYYFDHNEGRYVKNIQELPAAIPAVNYAGNFGNPLVFKWIDRGKQSSI